MTLSAYFVAPAALWLLLTLPVLWWALGRLFGQHRQEIDRMLVSPKRLIPGFEEHQSRRHFARRLFLLGVTATFISFAQPQWGRSQRSLEPRGVDLVICLDLSRSMLARDLTPSRLDRARQEITALTERTRGDRVGLVVFAGEAQLVAPLTRDMAALREIVAWLHPDQIPFGGSNTAAAIDLALQTLSEADGDHQAIVLVSDGDDPEARALALAKTCAKRGLSLHAFGLGTVKGAKIPILVDSDTGDQRPREEFLRDAEGREILSSLGETALRELARAGGGRYESASGGAPEGSSGQLAQLFDTELSWRARAAHARNESRVKENRFQWPLMLAFLFFGLSLASAGGNRS